MIYIGIDPGTHTGLAVWDGRALKVLETLPLHRAIEFVTSWKAECDANGEQLVVIFEDARQRKWYGSESTAKLQGAGSIKRDCSIWEEYLSDKGITFRAIPPVKGGTKLSANHLKLISGWSGRTSNHARDAAILVIGR